MSPILIALAILPGLAISYYIYRLDKHERESGWHLLMCFLLGMLITFPAIKLQTWTHGLGFEEPSDLKLTLFTSFVTISLSEELVKYLALLIFPFRQAFFNEPMDGIIYSVMIAMGFATLENMLYAERYGFETTLLRAFTAVPAHAVFGIIMGYFFGLAKFKPGKRTALLAKGLIVPVLIHGTYDFFIMQQAYDWLILLAAVTLAISIHFSWRLIRIHQDNSPFK